MYYSLRKIIELSRVPSLTRPLEGWLPPLVRLVAKVLAAHLESTTSAFSQAAGEASQLPLTGLYLQGWMRASACFTEEVLDAHPERSTRSTRQKDWPSSLRR